MANIKWSDFTATVTPALTDEIVGLQSGINKRVTLQRVKDLFLTGLTTNYLPKKTSTGFADSLISEGSGFVDVNGGVKVSGSGGFLIGESASIARIRYDITQTGFTFLTNTNNFADINAKTAILSGRIVQNGGVSLVNELTSSVSITNGAPYVLLTDTTNNNVNSMEGNDVGLKFYADATNVTSGGGRIDFNIASSDKMALLYNGNLLVGNTGVDNGAKLQINGDITTTAPSGGSVGKWKLGQKASATVSLVTTDYIQVEIDGVAYKLALVN